MFITTDEGRLLNLFLLQDVIVVYDEEESVYKIGYLQINGVIIKELSFKTKEEAETKKQTIIDSLLS